MSNEKVGIIKYKTRKSMYTTTVAYSYTPNAEAFITKGKNRLKQNGCEVYLNNNDEFEIELFNPKSINVLAKIKINGNYISQRGLVLKPGQRVHLDRYIDVAKKFMFSTYEVDGNDAAAMVAIANNGTVEIEFYDQQLSYNLTTYPTFDWFNITSNSGSFGQPANSTFTYTGGITANGTPLGGFSSQPVSSYYCSTNVNTSNTSNSTLRSKSVETGRVEQGGSSNTALNSINMDFNSYYTNIVSWKIKPQSQEPVQASDLKNYCTGCGYRIRKSSWTFCPSCGNKL
jgi:hypothetical protein